MKVAIIDLGTNTFHLLIAGVEAGEPKIIYKTNEPVNFLQHRFNRQLFITPLIGFTNKQSSI